VVAVAEPLTTRRAACAEEHGIDVAAAFEDWRELLRSNHGADAVVVATPDRDHAAATIAALEGGLDVILEKPIAPTVEEVRAVAAAASRSTGSVTVAHVLRYTAFFSLIKRLVEGGRIGELVTITHAEHIGYWHFAHSFVRGSWRNEADSSPMILAKACHDLDLLRWLADDRCTTVASFGGLHEFRPERAPTNALDRCWDGERRCPAAAECPFDAVRLYVERTAGIVGWPVSVITDDVSPPGRMAALSTGPYGRCVYRSDNDVADHQVAALEFANGVRATLTVSGLTADNTRTITLNGTRGEIRGRLDTGEVEVREFLPTSSPTAASVESSRDLNTSAAAPDGAWDRDAAGRAAMRGDRRELLSATAVPLHDGHGGGDDPFVADVIARLAARRAGQETTQEAQTSLAASVESHLMAFAAEESRRERRMVELEG
jgi:predicted dehydrogenase